MRIVTLAALLTVTTATTAYAQTPMALQPRQAMQPVPMQQAPMQQQVQGRVGVDSIGNGAIPSLALEVQAVNGVSYINGGIGDEELAQVKSTAGNYNLHVLLNAPNGEYISDVTLTLMDVHGTNLVTVNDAGPYFYAHLVPGTYMMQTSIAGGETRKTKFTVKSGGTVKQHVVYNQ